MQASRVIDPAVKADPSCVWFGANVTIVDEDDNQRIVTLVGDDESDASAGKIAWNSPMARALRGCTIGDARRVIVPAGERLWVVIAVSYGW